MTIHEEFITMVLAMREAQKAFDEKQTRSNMMERVKAETKVDLFIQKHISVKVQLDLWTRSVKGSEIAGVYDVGHGDEKEQAFEE